MHVSLFSASAMVSTSPTCAVHGLKRWGGSGRGSQLLSCPKADRPAGPAPRREARLPDAGRGEELARSLLSFSSLVWENILTIWRESKMEKFRDAGRKNQKD